MNSDRLIVHEISLSGLLLKSHQRDKMRIPLLAFCSIVPAAFAESYREFVSITPLLNDELYLHFQFDLESSPFELGVGRDQAYNLFPKSLVHMAKKHDLMEMHLSFSAGKWNYVSELSPSPPYEK